MALEATGSLSKARAALAERQAVGDEKLPLGQNRQHCPARTGGTLWGAGSLPPGPAPPSREARAVAGPGLAILVPFTPLYPLGLQASSTTSLERKLLTFLLGAHYIIY